MSDLTVMSWQVEAMTADGGGPRGELGPVRLSCSLITWRGDHERALGEIAALGFRAVEPPWRFARTWSEQPQGFLEHVGSHGLEISAMYATASLFGEGDPEASVEAYVEVGRFLGKIGVPTLVAGPAMVELSSDELGEDRLRRGAQVLEEAARRLAPVGVRVALHPHLWSEVAAEEVIEGLLRRTDPALVGLCVDTAHLAGAGLDLQALIRRHGRRCWHVHLKDLRPNGELRWRPKDAPEGSLLPFCELGDGQIDWDEVFAALGEVGYSGWLVVEIDHTLLDPRESVERCRDWLEKRYGFTTSAGF
jgi:inosose dehydratase